MNTTSLDEVVRALKAHKDKWARLAIPQKQEYLRIMLRCQAAVAERQVAAAVRAKSIPPGPLTGEEWAGGIYPVVRYLDLMLGSLEEVSREGRPRISQSALRVRRDGQLVVTVFPASWSDKMLYRNFRGEVWMADGVTPEDLGDHMAGFYRQEEPEGKTALVLGAGNVASIGPLDVLHKLYVEGQVCLLKLNPVNDYLGPFLGDIFACLIEAGYVRIVQGDADVGKYLCEHADVDEIHMTGSHLTHDAIVFGQGEEGFKAKQESRPRLAKRVTSELGNVSPVIVVPGPWTKADLRFHAENIATQMINNCGFNCCAAKVLILPSDWDLGELLMDEICAVLSAPPPRCAYYPGAEERYDHFIAMNPHAEALAPRVAGILPWTLIPDVSPSDLTNVCYTVESFCGLMAQTSLPGDAEEFLRRAVVFCNDRLWGTLNACIIIDPKTARSLGSRLEDSIAALEYGAVGVNHWPVLSFVWGTTTWGAFPGHALSDIQSGVGSVHNALLFDRVERSVIYGPFRVWPRPAWFITNRKADKIFAKLVRMHAEPGLANVLRVISTVVGG